MEEEWLSESEAVRVGESECLRGGNDHTGG